MHSNRLKAISLSWLLLLVLIAVLGSLHWIEHNVVLVGNDASGYLDTSLDYTEFLRPLSLRSIFQAVTYHDYRPTFLFIATQPFYFLFGPSLDSAQYINILMLAVVIVLTYLLGRTVADELVGLYAATMISFMPLVAAMARLYYTEIILTGAVTLCLLALYNCSGFEKRSWSLVWGTSLGVGLLTKWTLPIYVVLPFLMTSWLHRESLLPSRQLFRLKNVAIAIVLGVSISSLWYLPNRQLADTLPMGSLVYPVWIVLTSVTFAFLLAPSSPSTNYWGGMFLGVAIASLWYAPYADFPIRLLQEDQVRGQAVSGPLQLETHVAYWDYLQTHHFGTLAFWLIVPAAALPWLWNAVKGRSVNPNSALLWLSILSAYSVLILIEQRNARNLMPLAPSIAVLASIALFSYRKQLRWTLGVVWIGVLIIQWCIFTTDSLASFYQRTEALWAIEDYSRQPSSGLNDPGYWIAPDIIETITSVAPQDQRIGMLVHIPQLHRGVLKYLIDLHELDLEVKSLTEETSSGWYDLLSAQWVVVKDGDNKNVEAPGLELIKRITSGDPLFDFLYQPYKSYVLPNGEKVTLYHRAAGPGRPHDLPLHLEKTQEIANEIARSWSEHSTLIYADPDLAVWVGIHDPVQDRILVLESTSTVEDALSSVFGTLLVVLDAESDALQDWLNAHAYRTYEIGDDFASVAIYGRPTSSPQKRFADPVVWSDATLERLQMPSAVSPGEVMPIEVEYKGAVADNSKISYRVVGAGGDVIASHDRPMQLADRFGLFIPPSTPSGQFQLVAVRYDPVTLAKIRTNDGQEMPAFTEISIAEDNR